MILFFYSLIVSAALLLLAAAYRLSGLGRSRNFALSRAALVGSLLFALALGFVPFLLPESAVPSVVGNIEIGRLVVSPGAAAERYQLPLLLHNSPKRKELLSKTRKSCRSFPAARLSFTNGSPRISAIPRLP